ncbi:hypothetical protein BSZ36_09390 [Rubricoccus marinus]|uniref:ABC transporter substrate-binding protein n=1 Tax=Rubricoccus marinus TaxID=716817 RepID=A0A259TZZ5_9BACT|nr:hypothetical protein BSZ36_09390 [Rubricoccus marinus]
MTEATPRTDAQRPPRIAVWPVAPAAVLGRVLADVLGGEVVAVESHQAAGALVSGEADLALIPTLSVLRTPEAFSLVPGVGLVGERSPSRTLVLAGGLGDIETVAFDPRWGQEALLTQLLLREHYDLKPTFSPVPDGTPLAEQLAAHGAALVSPDTQIPDGAVVLDLGQEWTDLTTRPMVWGLVASGPGVLTPEAALALAEAVADAGDPTGEGTYQLSLTGLGYDGLEALSDHLFYTGTLGAIPELPFVPVTDEEPEADALDVLLEVPADPDASPEARTN